MLSGKYDMGRQLIFIKCYEESYYLLRKLELDAGACGS
jgi:hypothetical protein